MFVKIHKTTESGFNEEVTYQCSHYSAIRIREGDKKPSGFEGAAGLVISLWLMDSRCCEVFLEEGQYKSAGFYAKNDDGKTIDSGGWNLN